jgi:transcriptional regulator with XRE-family HTH domain
MDLSAPQLAAALVPTFPPDAPNSAEPDDLLPDDDALDAEFANDDEREQRRSTSLRIKQLRTAMRDRIPARLKEARKMNGLDLETAARYLGVTRAVLMGFEAGRRTVPGATCVAAAEQYAVSLDYLLGVSDEPERDPGGTIARQMREGARMLVERMSSAVIASTIRHGQQLSAVFDDAESLSSAADRTLRALERVRELNPEWQDMRGGATLEEAVRQLAIAAKALKQEAVRRRAFARRQIEAIRVSVAGMPDGQAIADVIGASGDPMALAA